MIRLFTIVIWAIGTAGILWWAGAELIKFVLDVRALKRRRRENHVEVPLTEQERAEREKGLAAQFVDPFRFILCGGISDPFCENCRALADVLCDYPVGDGKTCDAVLCSDCTTKVHPEGALEPLDLCPLHARLSRLEVSR